MNCDMELLLIADAGGTNTQWAFKAKRGGLPLPVEYFSTEGINGVVSDDNMIRKVFKEVARLVDNYIEKTNTGNDVKLRLYFYGAGCGSIRIKRRLKNFFTECFSKEFSECRFMSDLLGAARALFGEREGMACIIGTGSASCICRNGEIVDKIPSLGFILGDEGSGAWIGKELLNRYFKKALPASIVRAFEEEGAPDLDTVIERVYRTGNPNGYLASFVPFVNRHIEEYSMESIVRNGINEFFIRNINKYGLHKGMRIGFVGGVAYAFRTIVESTAKSHGFEDVTILKNPIEELVNYHKS